tara:strand:- start:3478 stop:8514 length:5037 start_codon:yes stop_codon:yes gene_type:complete
MSDLPNVLQDPRHFEDEPLSAWKLDGRQAIGPKQEFLNVRAFERAPVAKETDAVDPPPTHAAEPISVELVRGADGPQDDNWVVVIDGIRRPLPEKNADGIYTFYLPSGVAREAIRTDTVVRSVAVAVRLESEALAPMSVRATTHQALKTDERAVQSHIGEEFMSTDNAAVDIVPYRVSDIEASVAMFPYPIVTIPQATVGLMSLRPLKRWQEQQDSLRAFNTYATVHNAAAQSAYVARKEAYEVLKQDVAAAGVTTQVGVALAKLSNQWKDSDDPETDQERFKVEMERVTKVPPKEPTTKKLKYAPPEPKTGAITYKYGGSQQSIAGVFADIFELLKNACERQRLQSTEARQTRSLRDNLNQMRIWLMYNAEPGTRALFDALFSTVPYPPAEMFLSNNSSYRSTDGPQDVDARKAITTAFRRHFNICDAGLTEGGASVREEDLIINRAPGLDAPDLTEAQRQALYKDNQKLLRDEEQFLNATRVDQEYVFTYDRTPFEARKRTTLSTVIRITVRNFDDTTFEIDIRAPEQYGIVAHAVYAEFRKDIEDFDKHADEFIDCLFDVYTYPKDDRAEENDRWADRYDRIRPLGRLMSKIFPRQLRSFARANPADYNYVPFSDIWDIAQYAVVGSLEGVARAATFGAPFKFDPCKVEERVAELRLMAREILPVWPPVDLPDDPSPELPSAEAFNEANLPQQDFVFRPGVDLDDDGNLVLGVEGVDSAVAALLKFEFPDVDPSDLPREWFRSDDTEETPSEQAAKIFNYVKEQLKSLRGYFERASQTSEEDKDKQVKVQNARSAEATEIALEASGATMVVYRQDDELFTRLLPQLLVPSDVTFAYKVPDRPEPADRVYPVSGGLLERLGPKLFWTTTKLAASAVLPYILYRYMNKFATRAAARNISSDWWTRVLPLVSGLAPRIVENWGTPETLLQDAEFWRLLGEGGADAARVFRQLSSQNPQAYNLWRRRRTFGPIAANFATLIYSFCNRRAQFDKIMKDGWEKHKRSILGVPVTSAVLASKEAMKKMRLAQLEILKSYDTTERVGVVYNHVLGQRCVFVEHYEVSAFGKVVFETLRPQYNAIDWDRVPDSNALRLFPPVDITETLYEAEELRGVQLTKMVEFTTGNQGILVGMTPSDVAAKAAVLEIEEAVVSEKRRRFDGGSLMESTAQMSFNIVDSAARVLSAVFSRSNGLTLVGGSDIIWSCARGGSAARLAVRHLPLFRKSQSVEDQSAENENVKRLLGFWTKPRREMVAGFIKVLVKDASEILRSSNTSPRSLPGSKSLAEESARLFARVHTLANSKSLSLHDPDYDSAIRIVGAVIAHKLTFDGSLFKSFAQCANGDRLQFYTMEAFKFLDQKEVPAPRYKAPIPQISQAAWASRRVDVQFARSLNLPRSQIGAETRGGTNDLIQRLSGLQLESAGPAEKLVYFCPTGSRIDRLPGAAPFAVDSSSERVIWLYQVQEAAFAVSEAVREIDPDLDGADGVDDADTAGEKDLPKVRTTWPGDTNVTGVARHPLVVVLEGNQIQIMLSKSETGEPIEADKKDTGVEEEEEKKNMACALKKFSRLDDKLRRTMREKVQRARRIAHNAERFFFALSLATMFLTAKPHIVVELKETENVYSLCIALALLSVELGNPIFDLTVRVQNLDDAKRTAWALEQQMKLSIDRGCKVCKLAELVTCV